MTSNDDGMDWFDADVVEPVDPKAAAIEAVGNAARVALFNQVWAAFVALNKTGSVSRASLARELSIAPQAVSRLLRSPTNMTVETAARLLFVMGRELRFNCPDKAQRQKPSPVFHWADTHANYHFVRAAELKPHARVTLVTACTVSVIEVDDDTEELWVEGPTQISGVYSRKLPRGEAAPPRRQKQTTQTAWEPNYVH